MATMKRGNSETNPNIYNALIILKTKTFITLFESLRQFIFDNLRARKAI